MVSFENDLLDVPELFEGVVEGVDERDPILSLTGKLGGVRMQPFRLGVQPLLVKIGLGYADV